jgi:hypothetical protein
VKDDGARSPIQQDNNRIENGRINFVPPKKVINLYPLVVVILTAVGNDEA